MYFVCIDFINININVGCFEPPQISSIKVNLPFFLQRKLQHTLGEKKAQSCNDFTTADKGDMKPPTLPALLWIGRFDLFRSRLHLPTTAFSPQHSLISEIWSPLNTIYSYLQSDVSRGRPFSVRPGADNSQKNTQTEKKTNRKTGGDERNSWFQGRWTADWWRSSAEKKKTASEWMRPVWMRGCGAV